jgi:hypothetical protein
MFAIEDAKAETRLRPKDVMAVSGGPVFGHPDDGSHYYEYWLAALERLVTAKGLSNPNEMLARKDAWADAYRHTPHGKPVDLANESS